MTPDLVDPLEALQRAQVAALEGDTSLQGLHSSGVQIFDRVSSESFPYIVVGEDREVPEDTDCQTMSEVFSTVRVYSRAFGKVEAKRIAGRARFVLDAVNGFTIEGFSLIAGHCTDLKIHSHADGQTTQAELTFRYLVEPG